MAVSERRSLRRRNPGVEHITPGLVSSAAVVNPMIARALVYQPTEQQREAWTYFKNTGELNYAIDDWFGNAMSRIRLVPAVFRPGDEEPQPVKDNEQIAALVSSLANGISGQSAMLKKFAVHLSVPGESFLVSEDISDPVTNEIERTWTVYSNDEIRIKNFSAVMQNGQRDGVQYEVRWADALWRNLNPESLVTRIWKPDSQYQYLSTSSVRAALTIIREVDYYNRYIVSVLLSRLSMNGLLLMPQEATLPGRKEFKDSADPFTAELLDIATKAIANPGTAAASIPVPIRVPAELIDKFRHLTFDSPMGKEVIENRTRALVRLASALNLPGEVLTGMDNMNHWGQWQLEESAIKIHFSPMMELICGALTMGWLRPMMAAARIEDPEGGRYVLWYDTSQLSQSPDKGKPAQSLYDRGELNGAELRRHNGFDPDAEPSIDEIKAMALKRMALGGGNRGLWALSLLTGDESVMPDDPAIDMQGGTPTSPSADGPDNGQSDKAPPDTQPQAAGRFPQVRA